MQVDKEDTPMDVSILVYPQPSTSQSMTLSPETMMVENEHAPVDITSIQEGRAQPTPKQISDDKEM